MFSLCIYYSEHPFTCKEQLKRLAYNLAIYQKFLIPRIISKQY